MVKKYEDFGVSDEEFDDFLKFFLIDVNVVKFDDQFQVIIEGFVKQFGCLLFVVEFFYYNSVLWVIKELVIELDEVLCVIMRVVFIK